MRYIRNYVAFVLGVVPLAAPCLLHADPAESYAIASNRQVDSIDHVNILVEANGDVLSRPSSGEKVERQTVSLTCRRDYDEKTLQLPVAADKTLRGVRYYHEASATLKKAAVEQKPTLRPESRLVGVEIVGAKETLFSVKGPFNWDDLDLVATVGESLAVDQLLPAKNVKIGESWKASDDTLAILLGLEEITSNSVQVTLKELTPEFARLELNGHLEGRLYGADNRMDVTAKCRFNRQSNRIDWFAMRLKQTRDSGIVEDGLDWTVLVQIKISGLKTSKNLSDAALAGLPLNATDDLTAVRYLQSGGGCMLTHDRSWFPIDRSRDHDELRRLDHGQDIGLCTISAAPQVAVAKLPNLEQFQGIVQGLPGMKSAEVFETGHAETPASLRILREGQGRRQRGSHALVLLPRFRSGGAAGDLHLPRRREMARAIRPGRRATGPFAPFRGEGREERTELCTGREMSRGLSSSEIGKLFFGRSRGETEHQSQVPASGPQRFG